MTVTTVRVDFELAILIIGGIDFDLMLMRMMAEVSDCCCLLVLTIGSRHGPGHLQRQHGQQKNENQTFHGGGLYGTLRHFYYRNQQNSAFFSPLFVSKQTELLKTASEVKQQQSIRLTGTSLCTQDRRMLHWVDYRQL